MNDDEKTNPDCVECGETVDGMTEIQFADGSERWICPPCEDKLVEEHGLVGIE